MDAQLSAEQVAELRQQSPPPTPQELAKTLGSSKEEAETLLADLDALTPVWAGREEPRLVLILGSILVLLASLFAYSNNTEGAFLFDDQHSILTDHVGSLRDWTHKNVREGDLTGHKLVVFREGAEKTLDRLFKQNPFRVVTYATFAWEDWWFEGATGKEAKNGGIRSNVSGVPEPHVHWFNNLVHAFNGLLAIWLAYLTFTAPAFRGSKSALRYPALGAVLAGSVFSLHPLQTQAVSYTVQRAESLGTLFFLLTLCLLITARRRATSEVAGKRPYLTVLVWAGVLGISAALLVVAAKGGMRFSNTVYGVLVAVAAGIGASVYLVKQGDDERWHAAAVGGGIVTLILGLETKEILGVFPAVFVVYELLFGARAATQAPVDSLLPAGPSVLQRLWLWRSLRALMSRERARYHSPWIAGILAVLLAFPLVGGSNFSSQLAQQVSMGGRQGVGITPGNYILTQANVFHSYVRLSLLPYGQNVDHDYPLALEGVLGKGAEGALDAGPHARPLTNAPVSSPLTTFLSLLGLLGAIALALACGGRARVPAFGLVLALLVLGPSSSFIVLADVIFEHRFYLPLLGGALILPVVLERLLRLGPPAIPAGRVLLATAIALGLGGVVLTRSRNEVWKDDASLWGDASAKSPNKPRGWVNLGLHWQKQETHVVTYRRGSTLQQKFCSPRLLPGGEDLLLVQLSRQVLAPTVVSRKDVVEIGEFKETKDAPQIAWDYYQKAVAIEPYGKALNNLAIISVYRFQHLQQEQHVIRRQLLPRFGERGDQARVQACQARLKAIEGELDAAALEAEQALRTKLHTGPWDFFVYNNLGGLYSLTNSHKQATIYLELALKTQSPEPTTWAALGEAYQKWGVTRWRYAHQGGSAERELWIKRARESWAKSEEAFKRFLREDPGAPQAAFVRRSKERVTGWLSGRDLPPTDQPLPRTAVLD